ncbi:MAG TPA: MerR family transcriptional regulator [Candidatus Cybelea sp.]
MTESGYRLYGEVELELLEHILALRFVGFNLEQIRELMLARFGRMVERNATAARLQTSVERRIRRVH